MSSNTLTREAIVALLTDAEVATIRDQLLRGASIDLSAHVEATRLESRRVSLLGAIRRTTRGLRLVRRGEIPFG